MAASATVAAGRAAVPVTSAESRQSNDQRQPEGKRAAEEALKNGCTVAYVGLGLPQNVQDGYTFYNPTFGRLTLPAVPAPDAAANEARGAEIGKEKKRLAAPRDKAEGGTRQTSAAESDSKTAAPERAAREGKGGDGPRRAKLTPPDEGSDTRRVERTAAGDNLKPKAPEPAKAAGEKAEVAGKKHGEKRGEKKSSASDDKLIAAKEKLASLAGEARAVGAKVERLAEAVAAMPEQPAADELLSARQQLKEIRREFARKCNAFNAAWEAVRRGAPRGSFKHEVRQFDTAKKEFFDQRVRPLERQLDERSRSLTVYDYIGAALQECMAPRDISVPWSPADERFDKWVSQRTSLMQDLFELQQQVAPLPPHAAPGAAKLRLARMERRVSQFHADCDRHLEKAKRQLSTGETGDGKQLTAWKLRDLEQRVERLTELKKIAAKALEAARQPEGEQTATSVTQP